MILVAVSGLPGVGKTTVSGMVAERLGADRLRSDVVRKELYPEPTYDPAETEAVYAELLSRAGDRLGRGDPAVLDATFRRCARRDRVAAIADDHGVDARFVRVDCDEDVAKTRIAERDGDASDATVAVYEQLKGEFEPIEREHVRVDNSGSLAASRTQVTRAFADRAVGR